MTTSRKSEKGVDYTLETRPYPSAAEGIVFWRGSDGSVLELTYEEQLARDTSKSISDI